MVPDIDTAICVSLDLALRGNCARIATQVIACCCGDCAKERADSGARHTERMASHPVDRGGSSEHTAVTAGCERGGVSSVLAPAPAELEKHRNLILCERGLELRERLF